MPPTTILEDYLTIPPAGQTDPRPTEGNRESSAPPFPWKWIAITIGVFLAAILLLVIGFTIGSQDEDANETQVAPSTPATEVAPSTPAEADSSMDDWLEAVCAPGTYGASSNVLKNSITRPMSCRAPTRNGRAPIISIGTYDSNFLLKEDLHATNYGHVATATLTDGRMIIFALTRGVVSPEYFLNPLTEFGFDVKIGI